jgi:bacterioferritin
MKGDPEILAQLNQLLTDELTSADVYLLQARMCLDQGYARLFARLDHEKDDEMGHAIQLIERILLLEGVPDVQARAGFRVTRDVKEMLEVDLEYEYRVARNLNEAIALCRERRDDGTRAILERLLVDTEADHILWLEAQLAQIEQLGLELYLSRQVGAPAAPAAPPAA